jgi:hypothetical protein
MAALRTFGISLLAASISLSSVALAQDRPATPPSPENSAHSSGTSPEGMSSTGWSGSGLGGSHTGKSDETTGSGQRGASSDSAADQPEMATGADLQGPPHRFPANNTPE